MVEKGGHSFGESPDQLTVLLGQKTDERPPIHFLFDSDRALRDGDWKLVSYRGGPWELYQMAEDRTELHDLAGKQPERVAEMAAEWHRMTRDDLKAPTREQRPVADTAQPKTHPEWSDHSGEKAAKTPRKKR